MKTYNLKFLESVKLVDIQLEHDLVWMPFRPAKFLTKEKPAAFYYFPIIGGTSHFYEEEIREGKFCGVKYIVKKNALGTPCAYYRPHVKLTFVGGEVVHRYFDDYDKASEWANEMIAHIQVGLLIQGNDYTIIKPQ